MIEHHIYIYGEIDGFQEDDASRWGYVNAKDVRNQIGNAPEGTTDLIVHLNSYGGSVDAGFAMFDMLASSGYAVTTIVEGMVASIATVIMLAGTTRKITENSDILIHNPFAFTIGTADDLEKDVDLLRAMEDKIINLYLEKTTAEREVLDQLMSDEERIPAAKAVELGFATELIVTIKAVALLATPKKKEDKNPTDKKLNIMNEAITKLSAAVTTLVEKVVGKPEVKDNIELTTADGVMLEIITSEESAEVGNQVKIDGKVAEDGEYVMANKETFIVKEGKIETIKVEDAVVVDTAVTDELKLENEALAKSVEGLVTVIEANTASNKEVVDALQVEIDALKTSIGSDYKPPAPSIEGGAGNPNEPNPSPVSAAIEANRAKDEKKAEDK